MMINAVGNLSHVYASSYVDMARNEEVAVAERVPDFSSASGLEDFVLGGGIIDENGELIIDNSQATKLYAMGDVEKSDYVRESVDSSDIYSEVREKSQRSRILSYSFIQDLFPAIVNSMWGNSGGSLIDNLFGTKKGDEDLLNLLNSVVTAEQNLMNFQESLKQGSLSDNDFSGYFELNNPKLDSLADRIVAEYGAVTDDEKFSAIEKWVQKNLEYVSDMDNWGVGEYWAKPSETIAKGMKEDCDGGAILMSSLMYHADIPAEDIRWYGGVVRAGAGAETGGHAWVGYKRDSDNEWIIGEWCYLPNEKSTDKKTPMSRDKNYIDDFFTFHFNGATVDTPAVNGVRNPELLDRWDKYKVVNVDNSSINLGNFMNGADGLYVSRELARNGSLENGVGLAALTEDNSKMKLIISQMVDSARNENILGSLQKQYAKRDDAEGFGGILTVTNDKRTLLANALFSSTLNKDKRA
ncbi:MAG: transglutaminase-like domain-containing protein [archaeon]